MPNVKITTMEFLLIFFLIVAQFFYHVSSMPTPTALVVCKTEKFYDEVIFAWKPCSDCLTKEGSSFERQCIVCNCTVIRSSERPTSAQSHYKSEYYEKPSSKPSTTSVTTSILPTQYTAVNHMAILVGVITAVVLLVGIVIFCYCKRRDAEAPEGCLTCAATKKPTQCSNEDQSKPSNGEQIEPNHVTGRAGTDISIPVCVIK